MAMSKGIKANKKTEAKPQNEQINLDFLVQTTLGGQNAVEMLKSGCVVVPHTVGVGLLGAIKHKFDIPIEQWKLDEEDQVFLLFDNEKDRPVLVHQKSAIAALNVWIHTLNLNSGIEALEDLLDGTLVIGKKMILDEDHIEELEFERGEGKFGRYTIN